MGKSTINGPFSIAMLVYQRVPWHFLEKHLHDEHLKSIPCGSSDRFIGVPMGTHFIPSHCEAEKWEWPWNSWVPSQSEIAEKKTIPKLSKCFYHKFGYKKILRNRVKIPSYHEDVEYMICPNNIHIYHIYIYIYHISYLYIYIISHSMSSNPIYIYSFCLRISIPQRLAGARPLPHNSTSEKKGLGQLPRIGILWYKVRPPFDS